MSIDAHRTLPELVRDAGARFGERVALRHLGKVRFPELTYRHLAERVSSGAGELARRAGAPGARILLVLPPQPAWVASIFAIWDAGLVAVPVSPQASDGVLKDIATRVGATLAIVDDDAGDDDDADGTAGTGRHQDLGCPTLSVGSLLDSPAAGDRPTTSQQPGDVALLAMTSGSTGRPRAVALSHANLLWNVQGVLGHHDPLPDETLLSLLPPEHLFELVVGQLCPLSVGARIVYPTSLLPSRLFEAVRGQKVTRIVAVPALLDVLYEQVLDVLADAGVATADQREQPLSDMAQRLRGYGAVKRALLRGVLRTRFSDTLQALVVGGAAIDPAWADVCSALGIRLDLGYGLTEAGPVVTLGNTAECPAGSVGRPLPGVEIKIGEQDEILVRSDGVMCGYDRDEDGTRAALAGGWLHTGDQGCVDGDGFVFVAGRLKEAIVTSTGTTVYPEEMEPYYQDPMFAEHCVVPLSDANGNDVPVLLAVPTSPTATDEEVESTMHRLRAAAPSHCRVERALRITESLPRTATGKIRRRVLAEQLQPSRNTDVSQAH